MDKVSCKKFEYELEKNLDIILRKTLNKSYRFTRYKMLLFSKGPNKFPRKICVPTMRDKLVSIALNQVLNDTYEGKNKTPLPQSLINNITHNIPHYDYFIKLDISSFYGSISHGKLFEILKRKIRKQEILSLIKAAVQTTSVSYPIKQRNLKKTIQDVGVPEGLPMSNSLANIYLSDLDEKFKKMQHVEYYRYVDDILLLVREIDFKDIKSKIDFELKNLELEINDKKSDGLISNGFEYLGYKFESGKVTVRESSVLKLEQSLEDFFRKSRGKNVNYINWKLNIRITGFIWEHNKYGWLFFYSQITDMNLLFHLDNLVEKFCKRYGLSGKIKVKRFVRTYMEMIKALHDTKYIPNIDDFNTSKKREILEEIYDVELSDKSERSIDFLFRKIMRKEIRDVEKDIQSIS